MASLRSKARSPASLDFVRGPLEKTLILFAIPYMFSILLQTLYSTADTIVVGQFLDRSGLSAVSTGSQIMQMVYMLLIGFSSAGQVLIAQAKGAENQEKLQKIVQTLFLVVVLLSCVLSILFLRFTRYALDFMNTPPEAYEGAETYVIICTLGVLFTGLYNMFSSVLRGMGDSRHPLLFVLIATSLNIVLDLLFVVRFHWGISGVALATVIGQGVSVLFSVWYLRRQKDLFGLELRLHEFRMDPNVLRQLSSIGIPMAFQSAAVQFSFLFVGQMVNTLGVVASASFGVMQKVRGVPGILTQGLGMSAASIYGQNLGANRLDRVQKTVWLCMLYTSVCALPFALLFLLCPEVCFRAFTPDVEVLSYARMIMSILALEIPANIIMPACNNLVTAQGFVQLSFTVSLIDAFFGRIFLCWFCGIYLRLGARGFFLGYILGTYVSAIIVLIYFVSGLWKRRKSLA